MTAQIADYRSVAGVGRLTGKRLDKPRFNPATLFLLSPTIILLATLFVFPIGYSIYLGFTNLQLIGPHSVHYQFTGYQNIGRMPKSPQPIFLGALRYRFVQFLQQRSSAVHKLF